MMPPEIALEDLLLQVLRIPNPQYVVNGRHGEAALQDFLCAWLASRDIPYQSDPSWGIHAVLKYSEVPAVLLAAHMDSDNLDLPSLSTLQLDGEKRVIRHKGDVGLDCKTGIAIALGVLEQLRLNPVPSCHVQVLFTVSEESGQKGAIRAPVQLLHGVRHAIVIDRMTRGRNAPTGKAGEPLRHVVTAYKGVSLLDGCCGKELLELLEQSIQSPAPLVGIESPNCADALELRGRWDAEILAPRLLEKDAASGDIDAELFAAVEEYTKKTAELRSAMSRVAPEVRVSSMNQNPRMARYKAMQKVQSCLRKRPLDELGWFSCVNVSYDYDESDGCLCLPEMEETRNILITFVKLFSAKIDKSC